MVKVFYSACTQSRIVLLSIYLLSFLLQYKIEVFENISRHSSRLNSETNHLLNTVKLCRLPQVIAVVTVETQCSHVGSLQYASCLENWSINREEGCSKNSLALPLSCYIYVECQEEQQGSHLNSLLDKPIFSIQSNPEENLIGYIFLDK